MIRRTRLAWMCFGASLTAVSAAVAAFLRPHPAREDSGGYVFLIDSDPMPPRFEDKEEVVRFDLRMQQPVYAGKIFTECGIKSFDYVTQFASTDGGDTSFARVPLTNLTADKLHCVSDSARTAKIEMNFSNDPDLYPRIIL